MPTQCADTGAGVLRRAVKLCVELSALSLSDTRARKGSSPFGLETPTPPVAQAAPACGGIRMKRHGFSAAPMRPPVLCGRRRGHRDYQPEQSLEPRLVTVTRERHTERRPSTRWAAARRADRRSPGPGPGRRQSGGIVSWPRFRMPPSTHPVRYWASYDVRGRGRSAQPLDMQPAANQMRLCRSSST